MMMTNSTTNDSSAETASQSLTGKRNNNLVAESDLNAAIAAIQSRQSAENNNTDDDSFLRECRNSLCQNIRRIVQSQTDEAFHTFLYEMTKQTENDGSSNNNKNITTSQENFPEYDFDESELLETAALKRVHELRESVRQEANKIQHKRQMVLEKAAHAAQQQMKTIELQQKKTVHLDNTKLLQASQQSQNAMQQLQSVLNNLENSLKTVRSTMPESIANLEGTIHSIQNTVGKKELSQTEKAIIAASSPSDGHNDENMDVVENPEQRLAFLLS